MSGAQLAHPGRAAGLGRRGLPQAVTVSAGGPGPRLRAPNFKLNLTESD